VVLLGGFCLAAWPRALRWQDCVTHLLGYLLNILVGYGQIAHDSNRTLPLSLELAVM
jgi:hypothetical protein